MGYVFTLGDMLKYTEWSQQPNTASFLEAAVRLCCQMLAPQPREDILDIGCGSCFSLLKLKNCGLTVQGLEASPDIVRLINRKHALHGYIDVGDAHDMHYDDNAFSYACFFNSLEYMECPEIALAEAFRVARQKVFIGFFNRYALTYFRHRLKGLWRPSFLCEANYFSLWDIKDMTRKLLGPVPIQWQTLMVMPFINVHTNIAPFKYLPLGAFICVAITVNPRLTTNPLHLKHECHHGIN